MAVCASPIIVTRYEMNERRSAFRRQTPASIPSLAVSESDPCIDGFDGYRCGPIIPFPATGRSHDSKAAPIGITRRCLVSSVRQVESGRSVRWKTLHIILVAGMHIQSGYTVRESLHRLWMQQRQNMAKARPEVHAAKKLSKHAACRTRKKLPTNESSAARWIRRAAAWIISTSP